jgi:hypothetical protein
VWGDGNLSPPLYNEYYRGGNMPDSFNNTYDCIRTLVHNTTSPGDVDNVVMNTIYCRFADDDHFVEFYDLVSDPYQLNNSFDTLSVSKRNQYDNGLNYLLRCQGETCRRYEKRTRKYNLANERL